MLFCASLSCKVIQRLDATRTGSNYYDLFSIQDKQSISIDAAKLEASFKALQRQLHPDKFANASAEEKAISATNSSVVNQAYQILRSRVDRINYVLTTFYDVHVLEEGGSYHDPLLMAEVFDLRERVDDVGDKTAMLTLLNEVDASLETLGTQLEVLLKMPNATEAITTHAVRFKYLAKVREEVLERLTGL